jgi:hypothetical protein
MDPIGDFDSQVEWVLNACEKQVSTYPSLLRRSGLAYVNRFRVWKDNSSPGRCAYYIPFWLQDTFGLDQDTCRHMALGNAFGQYYILIQDEVMDTDSGEYKGHLLPMGNLFFLDFVAAYRSLFDSRSPFWEFFEKYLAEWAESVLWEREQHWGQAQEFEEEDLIWLARKAAPLKIPCAAMSLLAGRQEAIEPLEATIDNLIVAFQLVDDLRDWRADLARGCYTYFLTRVMHARGIRSSSLLTETEVKTALFAGQVLEEILSLTAEYFGRALESISPLNAPYLKAYIALKDREFKKLGEELHTERAQMIQERLAFLVQGASSH